MPEEMKTWWIIRSGNREGPFSHDELKAMVGLGTLRGEDQLWKDGLASAVHVSTVQELLPADRDPSPDAAIPATLSQRQEDIAKPLTPGRPIAQPDKTVLGLAIMAGVMLMVALLLYGESALQMGAAKAWHFFIWTVGPLIAGVTVLMMVLILMGRMDQARKARFRQNFANANGYEFTYKVTPNFGADILHSAMLTQGHSDWPCFNLLRGLRRGHYFQAVDYFFSQGKGGFSQTVIAIRLRRDSPVNFAIIQDFLEFTGRGADMVRVKNQPTGLPKGQILVSRDGCSYINLPSGFVQAMAQIEGANVEVLKDRLLVYKLRKVLTGEDYIRWIDFAMTLEEMLARQAPSKIEAEIEPATPKKEMSARTLMAIGETAIVLMSAGILWIAYTVAHTHLPIVIGLVIAAILWNAIKHLYLVHAKQEEHLDFFVSLSLGLLPVVLIGGVAAWLLLPG
jgi:hypothetical protein